MAAEQQQPEPLPQQEQEAQVLKRHIQWQQLIEECLECRKDIEPHWQFCAHCGVRLATQCPGCGNPLPPAGASICPSCGLAIPAV